MTLMELSQNTICFGSLSFLFMMDGLSYATYGQKVITVSDSLPKANLSQKYSQAIMYLLLPPID